MNRQSAQAGKAIILVLFAALILLVGFILYSQKPSSNLPSQTNTNLVASPTPTLKTYTSSFMKFSIQVPSDFQVEEKFASLTITSNNGQIIMDREATDFKNLTDYIKDLALHNHLLISDVQAFKINNLSAVSANLNNQKTYFIYTNGLVFSLFSTSPSLYPDLDQIAQSFRYNP